MNIMNIFKAYIDMKYLCNASNFDVSEYFEYCWYDDDCAELFFKKNPDETILGWDRNCLPSDPHYSNNINNKKPLLSYEFKNLNIYDEFLFHYMIFTLNSVTVIHKIDKYNAINDFMKNYCFFQLARMSGIENISDDRKKKLQSFLFHFFLYCHPVNEETLNSFVIIDNEITHLPSNIKLKEYSSEYYNYYIKNYHKYKCDIIITPDEIDAVKSLNFTLIDLIETGHPRINLIPTIYTELNVEFINNTDAFIDLYAQKTEFFKYLAVLLKNNKVSKYHDYYLSMFLQNYVVYILRDNFKEINDLFLFFKNGFENNLSLLINKIYGDATFIRYIMDEQQIKWTDFNFITNLFTASTKEMYKTFL